MGITTMSVGAFMVPEKGDPLTGVAMPEDEFTENTETLLSTLLTVKRNPPLESSATPNGCCPVGTSAIEDRTPLLILKADTVPASTFVAKTNWLFGWTATRKGLLWQDTEQLGAAAGRAETGVNAPVELMLNGTTAWAM